MLHGNDFAENHVARIVILITAGGEGHYPVGGIYLQVGIKHCFFRYILQPFIKIFFGRNNSAGKLALFKDLSEDYIISSMAVNSTAVMRIIHKFYSKMESMQDFYCGVMVSIAGFMSSPFFSVYGASKAALKIFIESVNVELEKSGTSNRILNVSPGSIKGTSFNNGVTDLSVTSSLAAEIISHLEAKDDLFIPQYEEIFKNVLARYNADFREEGRHSYEYKLNSGRVNNA
jgi:NAD(P)-dependent dehydrogenase (short-subunit alcohol dehydrogenase family)